ncbi:hypothetical protein L6Q21_04330 [Sandaracinobacter sp. RS1-74]|uniref:hypothetical protein n=1 Tax=Sandaracinobacteroides sayramensis TaxID=2913411 RepID=UPI001EDA0586|nr:hypothetical protein [Sandaracinobacteroides sayramensis]MCG2840208.1 hypothetical protein [Sandaracinobacteroides sayramensis]
MAERDPAERQLWAHTLVRLGGLGVATTGLWLAAGSAGHVLALGGGLLLVAKGAGIAFLGPKALNRWWRR